MKKEKSFIEFLKEKLGEKVLNKIASVRIGIAGCGGLGSNCAFNLVRTGFIKFKLIDFDIIEASNLSRQFYFQDQIGMPKTEALSYNLKKINPLLSIEEVQKKISAENVKALFEDCDIIVEAFDKADDKSMIVSSLLDTEKLIVSASGFAGSGNSDNIKTHRIKKNLIIIGDLETGIDKAPPLSPKVNVAAAKQADVILEYILKEAR